MTAAKKQKNHGIHREFAHFTLVLFDASDATLRRQNRAGLHHFKVPVDATSDTAGEGGAG